MVKPVHREIQNLRYFILLWQHWRRQWHSTPVLLPGKSRGWRDLVGCSPWGRWESDTTEWLHFHFSLSCIGEGNGNPLHCSCLENPRDGGAWWAAISGVTQSQTWLKWLSRLSMTTSTIESERGEWKSWLKTQHSENEEHSIQSNHFMANRWVNNGNSDRFYLGEGSKITADGDYSHEIKDTCSLEEKLWPT